MKKYLPGIMNITTLSIAMSLTVPAVAERAPEAAGPQTGTGTRIVSIQYDPQELASASGRANLNARIKDAAREVCGPAGHLQAGSLAMASRNRKCAEQAVSDALARIHASQLASAGG